MAPQPDKNDRMAESFLKQAAEGQDISHSFNHITPQDQLEVFALMKEKQAKTPQAFGNLELIDANNDGRLDDIIAHGPGGNIRDVYDTPREAAAKATAQKMLDLAKNGQPVQRLYDQAEDKDIVLHKIKQIQADRPDKYGNVKAIDQNGDGIMDDMKALVERHGRVQEIDVYDDRRDAAERRIQEQAGQVADRVIRDVQRGKPIERAIGDAAEGVFRRIDPRRR